MKILAPEGRRVQAGVAAVIAVLVVVAVPAYALGGRQREPTDIRTVAHQAIMRKALHAQLPMKDSGNAETIGKQLMCQCGCALTVTACEGTMTCSLADKMRATVRTQLDQGKSEKQILASFVADYGSKVLAAPRKSGFDLLAWVVPPLVLLAGAVVLWVTIRAWVAKGRRSRPGIAVAVPGSLDAQLLDRVEAELRSFDQ